MRFEGIDLNVRIQIAQAIAGRLDFRTAHVAGAEQNLPLQVREIHDVEIDQADAADACRGEIQTERRAEAAGADAEHFGLLELELTFHADFGHDQVAAVAQDFFFRKRDGRGGGAGFAAIPGLVAIAKLSRLISRISCARRRRSRARC